MPRSAAPVPAMSMSPEGFGQSVTVRCGEVETIEYNRDKGIGVTVYLGQQKGYASTSDFSSAAVRDTVAAAIDIARFTAADPCAGLADASLMATAMPDLDLYHPWALPVESAIDLARRQRGGGLCGQPAGEQFRRAPVSRPRRRISFQRTAMASWAAIRLRAITLPAR